MNPKIETINNHIDVINQNIDFCTERLEKARSEMINLKPEGEVFEILDRYKKTLENRIKIYQQELKENYEFLDELKKEQTLMYAESQESL